MFYSEGSVNHDESLHIYEVQVHLKILSLSIYCVCVCVYWPLSAAYWHAAPWRWATPLAPRCVACSLSSDWSVFLVWSAGPASLTPSCSAPASAALSDSHRNTWKICYENRFIIAKWNDILTDNKNSQREKIFFLKQTHMHMHTKHIHTSCKITPISVLLLYTTVLKANIPLKEQEA